MRKPLFFMMHLGVLLAARWWSDSAIEWLVTGVGLSLLLDRYATSLLPWAGPVQWPRELAFRSGLFLFGAAVAYGIRPGVVPLWEAGYRGAFVCLGVGLLAAVLGLATRVAERFGMNNPHGCSSWRRLILVLPLAGLLVLSIPYMVTIHPLHTVPKRSPAALGLDFEEISIRTADGVRLGGWLVPHEEARGCVLFCHGHGRNRGHVAGLLSTLHGMGLSVLAFDFRGHGESGGHTSTFGHREVEDVLAAAAYLRERYPGKPLLLVGVSMGAAVALQALPRLPDVCGVWSEGCFDRLSDVVDSQFDCLPISLRGALVAGYNQLGWWDCGLWGPNINPIEALDGITVPICFCHGRRDELVPFAEAEALHDAYKGPRWHFWVNGASHYNPRQLNPNEYLGRLRAFLAGCLAEMKRG